MKKLKLYRAVKTNWMTQDFGENKACAKLYPNGWPIRPFRIVSKRGAGCPIGYKPFYPLVGLIGHNGRDWSTFHGEPVYFPCEFKGWLKTESDNDGGLGVDIISYEPILEDENGDLQYVKWRAWHLKKENGKDMDSVVMGGLIGFADNTGASSGDHLHESPKWCDKDGHGIKTDNGYQGAITPEFLDFENVFVLDVIGVKAEALSVIQQTSKLVNDIKIFIRNFIKL